MIWGFLIYLDMVFISDLRKNWAKVKLRQQVPIIIEQTKNEIIRLNTQDQLFILGEDSLGNKLPPYQSASYGKYKATKNPSGVTDLKLYGGFYAGWQVEVTDKYFNVFSTDSKADKLQLKYGQYIFGLNKPNTEVYAFDFVYPKIQTYITDITGLTFR